MNQYGGIVWRKFWVNVEPRLYLAPFQGDFEKIMDGVSLSHIGQVTDSEVLEIYGLKGDRVISKSLGELKEAW